MSVPRRVIVLDRYPDDDAVAWGRLIRDVVGGGAAASPLIEALDRPVEPLLAGVDVEAALAAADDLDLSVPVDEVPAPDPSDEPARVVANA